MAKLIKSVKVSFLRMGMATSSSPRKTISIPTIGIELMDNTKVNVNLANAENLAVPAVDITKKNYLGEIVCGEFFAIVCSNNMYHTFDDRGNHLASKAILGTPVQADENNFIVKDENEYIAYNAKLEEVDREKA